MKKLRIVIILIIMITITIMIMMIVMMIVIMIIIIMMMIVMMIVITLTMVMMMETSVAGGEKQTPSGIVKMLNTRKVWRLIRSGHRIGRILPPVEIQQWMRYIIPH